MRRLLKVDLRDWKNLEAELTTFKLKALPFAIRDSLNAQAFLARKVWQARIKRKLTLRNKWTLSGVRVEKTGKTLSVRTMQSKVGHLEPYMREQEYGTTHQSKGKHGVPIASSYAAGQAMGTQPRKRLVRRPNKIGSIRLTNRPKHSKRYVRNIIAARRAARSGSKYVYLNLSKSKGLFKVIGGRKRPKLRMVADLSRKSVKVPPHPTLGPSVKIVRRSADSIYRVALLKQVRRHRLFNV